jgi:hypothetical protein
MDEKHDDAAEIGRVLAARRPKRLLHRPETCNCSPTVLQNEGQPSGKREKVECELDKLYVDRISPVDHVL